MGLRPGHRVSRWAVPRWGEFSHVAIANGCERDKLSVIAAEDCAGGWTVTHTVTRAAKAKA